MSGQDDGVAEHLQEKYYLVQGVYYRNRRTHRILQDDGCTCALIGICNALLFKNDLRFTKNVKRVTFPQLQKCLSGHFSKIFDRDFSGIENAQIISGALENTDMCVASIPKLAMIEGGLNINISFKDCNSFQFTTDIALFDTLSLKLFHGCVVDPNVRFNYIKHINNIIKYNQNRIIFKKNNKH